MNCWQALGLAPTVEKIAIKRAYAKLLKQHNPEDDPAGFQRLRAAYEAALAQSNQIKVDESAPAAGFVPERPISEADSSASAEAAPPPREAQAESGDAKVAAQEFMQQVMRLYRQLELRIQPQAWQHLLQSDQLWRIEVKQYLAVWLFQFVAEYRHLPPAVYALLSDQFYWQQNHTQLQKLFGAEITDQVFQRMASAGWRLGYEGIRFGDEATIEQCEHYLDGREYLDYLVRNGEQQKIDELLPKLVLPELFDPELLRLLALNAERNGHSDAAIDFLEALCQGLPNRVDGWLHKAKLLFEKNDFRAAMTAYQQVLSLDEVQVIALRGLAACYFELGDTHAAKLMYEQARELQPFDIEARIRLLQINEKLIEEGRAELDKSKARDKGSWRRQVAQAYLDLGRYQACIDFLDACDGRGQQYQEAAKIMALALLNREQQAPFHCLSYDFQIMRGQACEGAEQWERAQFDYENALLAADKSEGNAYEAFRHLGKLAIKQQNYVRALEFLQKALPFSPDNHELLYEVADAVRLLNRLEDSLVYISQAIALDSDRWIYYSLRSLVLMALERYQQASEDLDVVVANSTYYAWAWYRKGYCLSQLGHYRQAVPYFKQATEYMADFSLAYEQLCEAACRAGDIAAAQRALSDFIASGGDAETAARLRGLCTAALSATQATTDCAGV